MSQMAPTIKFRGLRNKIFYFSTQNCRGSLKTAATSESIAALIWKLTIITMLSQKLNQLPRQFTTPISIPSYFLNFSPSSPKFSVP